MSDKGMPKIKAGESQLDYIERAMKGCGGEDEKKAEAYKSYRKQKGKDVTKSEIMNELMFEKARLATLLKKKVEDINAEEGDRTEIPTQGLIED